MEVLEWSFGRQESIKRTELYVHGRIGILEHFGKRPGNGPLFNLQS